MKKLVILFICLLYTFPSFADVPNQPKWFYRDKDYCSGNPEVALEENGTDAYKMTCDNTYWGGLYPQRYLEAITNSGTSCVGCAKYVDDLKPTFWWNITDNDTASIYYEFRLKEGGADLTSGCDIVYISDYFAEGDIEFSIGDDSGDYSEGSSSTTLGTWGATETYYWAVRGCDDLNRDSSSCGDWLVSGDGTISDADIAFNVPAYFNSDVGDPFEIITAVTGTGAKVNVVTPHTIDYIQINYGQTSSYGLSTTPLSNQSGPISLDISGLTAGTNYHYQVQASIGDDTFTGEDRTFTTARPKLSPFTFVVTADLHNTGHVAYMSEMKSQLEAIGTTGLNPDFWVDLGDLITPDHGMNFIQSQMDGVYLKSIEGIAVIANSIPFVQVQGNHESINQYFGKDTNIEEVSWMFYQPYINNPVMISGVSKLKYLPSYDHGETVSPDYKTFYSYEWGDALFVVIDPYTYTTQFPRTCTGKYFTLGSVQSEWLKNKIKDTSKPWIFILSHQHMGGYVDYMSSLGRPANYCYGRGGAETFGIGNALSQVASVIPKTSQAFVLLGHDHVYAKSKYKNINIISCPTTFSKGVWFFDEMGHREANWLYDADSVFTATISDITGNNITYTSPTNESELLNVGTVWNFTRREMINSSSVNKTLNTITRDDTVISETWGNWEVGDTIKSVLAKTGFLGITVNTGYVEFQMYDEDGAVIAPPDDGRDYQTSFIIVRSAGIQ